MCEKLQAGIYERMIKELNMHTQKNTDSCGSGYPKGNHLPGNSPGFTESPFHVRLEPFLLKSSFLKAWLLIALRTKLSNSHECYSKVIACGPRRGVATKLYVDFYSGVLSSSASSNVLIKAKNHLIYRQGRTHGIWHPWQKERGQKIK